MEPLAVYIHIPFCPSKCGYCDFNSYAMEGEIKGRTARAIAREILESPHRGRPARTIFFGGGTPTHLEINDLLHVFQAVMEAHPPVPEAEITSEANPGTVDAQKFGAMRSAGFSRISMGAQSFLDADLIALDRVHRGGDIERAYAAAREAGFENINLDLMFGLPNQSRHGWTRNLRRALALEPEHLSLYCLTIEPNTAFYRKQLRGELDLPDDEAQVAMYDETVSLTAAHGFRQYEISNFAKPDHECRHNLAYWHGKEYAGYGPGAVGQVSGSRYTNLKHPVAYCDAIESGKSVAYERESLSDATRQIEKIMLGLRLNEGIGVEGLDPTTVNSLLKRGWLTCEEDTVRLTPQGRHFCSEVTLALI